VPGFVTVAWRAMAVAVLAVERRCARQDAEQRHSAAGMVNQRDEMGEARDLHPINEPATQSGRMSDRALA
jgi:hypothetical protein